MNAEDAHTYALSNPNCFTKWIVNCPVCLLAGAIVFMIIIAVIVMSQGWVLPDEQKDREFLVWGDDIVN